MDKLTADEYRALAGRQSAAADESFERSDTDGFLSQWASNLTASVYLAKAHLAENGWMVAVEALFDLDGNLVPAVYVSGQYGMVWRLLDPTCWETAWSRTIGWFSPSKAEKNERRIKNDAKKGFYVGVVRAPADAKIMGGGHGLSGAMSCYVGTYRTDGGFSTNVEIVDNGKNGEE